MRKFLVLLLVLFASFSLLAGCSDDEDTVDVEDIVPRFAQAQCERMERCCEEDELGEPKSCEDRLSLLMAGLLEFQLEGIEEGRIGFDGETFARCMNEYAQDGCEEGVPSNPGFVVNSPGCEEIFSPQVEVGGECITDDECIDSICNGTAFNDDGELAEKGVCTPQVDEGEACDNSEICRSGLTCTGATYDGSDSGVCTPLNVGEACESFLDCDTQLDCDEDEGVCVELSDDSPEGDRTCYAEE